MVLCKAVLFPPVFSHQDSFLKPTDMAQKNSNSLTNSVCFV